MNAGAFAVSLKLSSVSVQTGLLETSLATRKIGFLASQLK